MRTRALLLVLGLGCRPPSGPAAVAGADSAGDTGGRAPWPALSTVADWSSTDWGYATGAARADLDRDGDADLVVAYGNDMEPGPLVVYRAEGDTLSRTPDWLGEGLHHHGHLSVGDLDGDGWPDVAVSLYLGDGGFGEPGGVHLYRNDGGTLEDTPGVVRGGFHSFSCALGDVDGDGDLDLAVATGEAYRATPEALRVFENDGAGGLSEEPVWTSAREAVCWDVAWLDHDGDGWLDLAAACQGAPHALYRGGPDGLGAAPVWEAPGAAFEGNTVDWGDLDGDGALDLVISDGRQLGGSGRVTAYCGADLAPCWQSADAPTWQSAVSLEDLDGDGRPELVAGSWWGAVRAYGNGPAGLSTTPDWRSDRDDLVVEAFAWAAPADTPIWDWSGRGLQPVPGRAEVLSVSGGLAAGGWVSGPGAWTATLRAPAPRTLLVSDWEPASGNLRFGRAQ